MGVVLGLYRERTLSSLTATTQDARRAVWRVTLLNLNYIGSFSRPNGFTSHTGTISSNRPTSTTPAQRGVVWGSHPTSTCTSGGSQARHDSWRRLLGGWGFLKGLLNVPSVGRTPGQFLIDRMGRHQSEGLRGLSDQRIVSLNRTYFQRVTARQPRCTCLGHGLAQAGVVLNYSTRETDVIPASARPHRAAADVPRPRREAWVGGGRKL